MIKLLVAAYGIAAYLLFQATIVYVIAFVGNLPIPKTIDVGLVGPTTEALAVDVLLLLVFAVQHSVMARSGFKRIWNRLVPPSIERSTYVLAASLALAAMMLFWRAIPTPIVWNVEQPWAQFAILACFWGGWLVLLVSSFLINHFELFGLQQVSARVFGKLAPPPVFRTPLLYRHVRHPIYLGFLISFWATPRMTAGHLLFSVAMTSYVFVGIYFEERELVALFDQRYRDYQRRVGMLLPWRRS